MRNLYDEILNEEHKASFFDSKIIKKNFIEMLNQFDNLKDNNFDKEIKESYEKFQQRFFEAYIGCFLLNNGFYVKNNGVGPDFVFDNISIECIAPTSGESNNRIPKMYVNNHTDKKFKVNEFPIKEIMLRLSSAMKTKYDKYIEDIKKGIVASKINIIAINDGLFEYSKLELNLPTITKVLYGVGNQIVNLKKPKDNVVEKKDSILNSNEQEIVLDYFTTDKYKQISAVIFSNATIFDIQNEIGYDLILIRNPFAEYPITNEFDKVKFCKDYYLNVDKQEIELK